MMKKIIVIISLMIVSIVMYASPDMNQVKQGTDDIQDEVHKFDRGITKSNTTFIPKGTVGTGITFSYNTMDFGQAENDPGYSLLSLVTGIKGCMYSFGIAPNISYFVRDNLAVGLRFDYDRAQIDIDNLGISIGDMLSLGIADYHTLSHNFGGALTCRYYMPFGDSKRFAMFAEGRLSGGYGESVVYKMDQGDKFGTYQTSINASLDLVPGLSAFMTNNVALEVSIGVLGVNYKRVEQVTNQVETSVMSSSGANFKLNLFSVNMGISLYLPGTSKNNKRR